MFQLMGSSCALEVVLKVDDLILLDAGRLQKEKSSKTGQLQQQALSRVEEKVNLSKMNIKEFRKEEPFSGICDSQDSCCIEPHSIRLIRNLLKVSDGKRSFVFHGKALFLGESLFFRPSL